MDNKERFLGALAGKIQPSLVVELVIKKSDFDGLLEDLDIRDKQDIDEIMGWLLSWNVNII